MDCSSNNECQHRRHTCSHRDEARQGSTEQKVASCSGKNKETAIPPEEVWNACPAAHLPQELLVVFQVKMEMAIQKFAKVENQTF